MVANDLFEVLPSHWDILPLGEACSKGGGNVQTGPFGSQLHASDYVPVGIPFVMPQNIGDNRILTDGIARITPADAERLDKYSLRKGDIIYSRRGDVKRRALIREEEDGWMCGSGCLRVRFGEGLVDPLYASYYLGHPSVQDWVVRHAVGATMPNLNTSILSALPFVVPPLDGQARIAHILGTLDDKIELNQQMNRTLEGIARALFKSWFIDFDPVRAKLDGRQPSGMDAETAALFPDAFEDGGEIGPIPQGWKAKKWGEITTLEYGKSLRGYKDSQGPYRVYGTNGPIGWHSHFLCNHEGIIIGRKGAYRGVHYSSQPFFVIDTAFYLEPKVEFDWIWAYYELTNFDINSLDSGSAIPSTSREDFYSILVCLPDSSILKAFGERASLLYEKRETNQKEQQILASTRDALLPKLLSGEVCVKEAEQTVEAVARC